jgi:hypothetical protein
MSEIPLAQPPEKEHFYGFLHHDAATNFILKQGNSEQLPDRKAWISNVFNTSLEYAKEHNDDPAGIYFELHRTKEDDFVPIVAIEDMDYEYARYFGTVNEYSGHNLAQIYRGEESDNHAVRDDENRTRMAKAGLYGIVNQFDLGDGAMGNPILRGRIMVDAQGNRTAVVQQRLLDLSNTYNKNFADSVAALSHLDVGVEIISSVAEREVKYEKSADIESFRNSISFVNLPHERMRHDGGRTIIVLGSLEQASVRTQHKSDTEIIVRDQEQLRLNWLEGYAKMHDYLLMEKGLDTGLRKVKIKGFDVGLGATFDYRENDKGTVEPVLTIALESSDQVFSNVQNEIGLLVESVGRFFDDELDISPSVEIIMRPDGEHAFKPLHLIEKQ